MLLWTRGDRACSGNMCHFYTCPSRPEGDWWIHFVPCSRLTRITASGTLTG